MTIQAAEYSDIANQPAVPVSNGTLAMWLFLTTEAMFFAALIGAWIVVRATAGETWPSQHSVHVNWLIGVLNTVVLFASGVTAWRAAQLAERNTNGQARLWILATMVLGSLFLGIKGYEYYEKYELGLVNVGQSGLIHDRADSLYVSAVGTVIKERLANDTSLTADETQSLELIQQGLVGWTSSRAGRTSDAAYQQQLYDSLAMLILPLGDSADSAKFLAAENQSLTVDLEKTRAIQKGLETKLEDLQKLLAGTPSESDKTEATSITLQLSAINLDLVQMESRIRALGQFAPEISSGINLNGHPRLPVVVRGGRMWASTWLLLTGIHAVHMLAGLLAWLIILPIRGKSLFSACVGNGARYWHFVDAVWLVIFLVVYCF